MGTYRDQNEFWRPLNSLFYNTRPGSGSSRTGTRRCLAPLQITFSLMRCARTKYREYSDNHHLYFLISGPFEQSYLRFTKACSILLKKSCYIVFQKLSVSGIAGSSNMEIWVKLRKKRWWSGAIVRISVAWIIFVLKMFNARLKRTHVLVFCFWWKFYIFFSSLVRSDA